MGLKRKRSSPELCSSPMSSGSSLFSSPPTQRHAMVDFAPCPTLSNPSHLHSRTMKRYRDNRPSEEEIHQRTLGMLFSAAQQEQEQQQQATPEVADSPLPAETMVEQQPRAPSSQQSLHRFWSIHSQPTTALVLLDTEPEQEAFQPGFAAGPHAGYIQSTLDQTPFVQHSMT